MKKASSYAIFVTILLIGLTAGVAQAYDYNFVLDPAQSNITVILNTDIGSDSDSSSVTGTIGATLTPNLGSFTNIQVTDINAFLTSNLSLYVEERILGIRVAYVDADLNGFGLLMGQGDNVNPPYGLAGLPTTVTGGSFNQTGNLVQGVGQVNYDYDITVESGSGSILMGNEDPFDVDFAGTVFDNGTTTTLTVPLNMSFSDSGVSLSVTGQLLATAATAPEPPEVHYMFTEVTSGQWEVSAEVTGEGTSGLSAYSTWVYNTDPALVSYTENALFDYATFRGFLPPNLVQGDVGGDFNVGNYQSAGDYGLTGVGLVPISMTDVDLDVPALLGILSTPAGLGEDDFAALSAGLLNATNDDYLTEMIVSYEVDPLDFLLGDANHDGLVSADDYVSVQSNFGSSGAAGILGDANLDGLVSADDYASVQANFGATSGGMSEVPEPATLGLLLIGGLALLKTSRRGRI